MSPSSVEVNSDIVETLNAGEEIAVMGISTQDSEGDPTLSGRDGTTLRKAEKKVPMLATVSGGFSRAKAA